MDLAGYRPHGIHILSCIDSCFLYNRQVQHLLPNDVDRCSSTIATSILEEITMIVRHRSPISPFDLSFDRAFEQLTNTFYDSRRQVGPLVDGGWQGDEYVITVDLPGVPADAVTVDVAGATLTLSARTDSMEWQRSIRLGGRLDPDKVRANHVDGRLTVRVGTFDEPETRRIEIDTAPVTPAIEATADTSVTDAQSTDTTSTG
jgi:HSP20 family protein